MKRSIDLARRFLALADRDIKTLRLLVSAPDSDEEAIGFHAQQAVEKCLKAVLSLHAIPFRKTHDLGELVDVLRDQRKAVPPNAEALDALNPFAVTFRYDFIDLEAFDRGQAKSIVDTVRRWAEDQLL